MRLMRQHCVTRFLYTHGVLYGECKAIVHEPIVSDGILCQNLCPAAPSMSTSFQQRSNQTLARQPVAESLQHEPHTVSGSSLASSLPPWSPSTGSSVGGLILGRNIRDPVRIDRIGLKWNFQSELLFWVTARSPSKIWMRIPGWLSAYVSNVCASFVRMLAMRSWSFVVISSTCKEPSPVMMAACTATPETATPSRRPWRMRPPTSHWKRHEHCPNQVETCPFQDNRNCTTARVFGLATA